MNLLKQIADVIGYVGTAWIVISGVIILIAWLKGILVPVWRLGDGLAKRKITIFAKGDNQESFKNLLLDSNLFNTKNIRSITTSEDLGRCEDSTLYLVVWDDFGNDINNILNKKNDKTSLIVFAKQNQLQPADWDALRKHRNVTIVNFKGRLMNDILVSLLVSGYDK